MRARALTWRSGAGPSRSEGASAVGCQSLRLWVWSTTTCVSCRAQATVPRPLSFVQHSGQLQFISELYRSLANEIALSSCWDFPSSVWRRARLEWPFMFFGASMKLHVSPTTSRPLTHAEWKLTRVAVALIDDDVRSAQRCSAAELRAVLLQCAQTASS